MSSAPTSRSLAALAVALLAASALTCAGEHDSGSVDAASPADTKKPSDGQGGSDGSSSPEGGATPGDGQPGTVDGIGPLPDADLPSCSFAVPRDGDEIADDQTYVEIVTEHVADGSVAAILVDFAPAASAQVKAGKAEFPTVKLPPPSDKPVELRAEVRDSYAHKIYCYIHVKVTGKAP